MKKRYYPPQAGFVKLVAGPIMNIIVASRIEIGTGGGSAGDDTPELAPKPRGEWGNLWKR